MPTKTDHPKRTAKRRAGALRAVRSHRQPSPGKAETADAYRAVAARLGMDPTVTLHTTTMTPEREAILEGLWEQLTRVPTDVLIAWLPVFGKFAADVDPGTGTEDSAHLRIAPGGRSA